MSPPRHPAHVLDPGPPRPSRRVPNTLDSRSLRRHSSHPRPWPTDRRLPRQRAILNGRPPPTTDIVLDALTRPCRRSALPPVVPLLHSSSARAPRQWHRRRGHKPPGRGPDTPPPQCNTTMDGDRSPHRAHYSQQQLRYAPATAAAPPTTATRPTDSLTPTSRPPSRARPRRPH